MNGLRVERLTYQQMHPGVGSERDFYGWMLTRNYELIEDQPGAPDLATSAEVAAMLTLGEWDWLLRGYHEWASLEPGECWPKEGNDEG